MNILLLEDEERNANRLIRLLHDIDPSFQINGPLASIAATKTYLLTMPDPDLILADIRLSDGLSFEALKSASVSVPIIFTTAYDEYAIRAFKFNSFDYLLKPIDADELADTIDRLNLRGKCVQNEKLQQLFDALSHSNYRFRERFLLPYRDGYKTINTNDVNHIHTKNKTTHLYLNNGTEETVIFSMDELEKQLNPDKFFRANRQFIINMESILFVGNYFGGKLIVKLKGYPEVEVIISKEKTSSLKDWIDR